MKRFGSEEPGPPFNFLAMAQYESKPGGSYATGNAPANTGVGGGAGHDAGGSSGAGNGGSGVIIIEEIYA